MSSLLNRETTKRRLNDHGMSYLEFSYQMLQAYDFYNLYTKENCYIQIGGSDQWGNICAGCHLIRKVYMKLYI